MAVVESQRKKHKRDHTLTVSYENFTGISRVSFFHYPDFSFSNTKSKSFLATVLQFSNFISDLTCNLVSAALLHLHLPNEVIDNVLSYLTSEDLLNVARISSERLKNCSYRIIRKRTIGLSFFAYF